jgi:hypothetical protein
MRIAKKFGPYNDKQQARPWIAKVVEWRVGQRAELQWGTFLGDDNGGEAEIEAAPGDVVLYGQKGRAGHHGFSVYALVTADGCLQACNEIQAAKAFRDRRGSLTPTVAAVQAYMKKK